MSSSGLNLPPAAFTRFDEAPDDLFYEVPRFVTHIEDETIDAVTNVYRQFLPSGGAILDWMSSWVSHLPPEVDFARVAVLGLNREELEANPRADDAKVQNLNENPILPYETDEFDAATNCVSIQYLTRPVEVLRDLARVVKPGGPAIITFSNRCFPTKAVALWQNLDDVGHAKLVMAYLQDAGWQQIEAFDATPAGSREPLIAVVGRSPDS